MRLHCAACNSQRPNDPCWKCGGACHEPADEWEYPELPPVDRIRELAKEYGYAIGEHGSRERDLDLIAAPWGDQASDYAPLDLATHIAQGLGGHVVNWEQKPHGRIAFSIQMSGWYKLIDLSVCPTI